MADKKEDLIPDERMKDMSVAPGEPERDSAKKDSARKDNAEEAENADRDEDNLDEGLEESMDASDVPSSIQP